MTSQCTTACKMLVWSRTNENYKRSMDDRVNDDDMEPEGQGTGGGTSTTPEPTTGDAEASADGAGKSTAPDMHDATNSPSNPEEEFQISQDKGAIIEAIDALFAMADDSNVCLKCGESGHPNYECPTKGSDQASVSALTNLKKKLQGDDVEDKETSKKDDSEEQERFRQENYKATREGEYMYLQAIPLSVIGDRAHGEKSINGVRSDEKGPMTKGELNQIVDTASQKGVTMTCKEMKSAMAYSDHKMYKKLRIGTDIGKLKILPVNGGKFYSSGYAGHGVEYPLPMESNENRVQLENWEKTYSYYFNKALRHHIGRKDVWERTNGGKKTIFSGLKCDEAGWVDIMDFLHHPWIFDHENVRTEDDGLVGIDFREDRVNTTIKTVWSEFQEKNKVRIQFLCIVLDSTFDKPDDYLRDVMKVGDDIHELIAKRGEVILAPVAVRSPGGFSAQGNDFRLDYGRICHPITTKIADDIYFCYHVTEFKNVIGIIKEGLRPGGHRGGTQVFLNPFVPWDKRCKEILGGQLTHLGQPRMVLAFSVHRLMSLGVMINASGQMVVNGNIPFSEVVAAWYQANNYGWERLLVDSGKFQLVRSCNEPKEIATANTVCASPRPCWTRSTPRTTFRSTTSSWKTLKSSKGPMECWIPAANLETALWRSFPRTTPREKLDTWFVLHASLRLQMLYPSASDAMVRWSAGGKRLQNKMKAPPLACQNENAKKAEMATMTMTKTSRWRMRSKTRLIDWSGSQREQQGWHPMMTSTWRTRSQAERKRDLEATENVQHQTKRWRSAATPRNSRRRRTSELPKNKNTTKSKEKPGSICRYGQRGRSRHLSFNVSTLLRTRMQSTAPQEQ